jgi:23S rRNA pseudouridine955/2504/2580 synthase/23S rRNA pseudouridine1911/1915/1917 synthase
MLKPDIFFENNSIVAVNKPSGLLTLPDRFDAELDSLKGILNKKYGQIFVVHRLDKDTSGLIIFAKTPEAHQYYSRLFEERKVEKIYVGLVHGTLPEDEGSFDQPIGEHPFTKGKMAVVRKGKHALTYYTVLESFGKYSWVSFRIETGRTHQIRVHLQNAGHPLLCDTLYGSDAPLLLSSLKKNFKLSKSDETERPLMNRLALHAWKLKLPTPEGKTLELEAPLPKDLEACLKQLRKWKKK